jgi:hypothetical protein
MDRDDEVRELARRLRCHALEFDGWQPQYRDLNRAAELLEEAHKVGVRHGRSEQAP